MKTKIKILSLGLLLLACHEPTQKSKEQLVVHAKEPEVVEVVTAKVAEKEKESPALDCVFDMATQTDEFIKHVPEFSNYTWDDDKKTATITLENGDEVLAHRGGCDHFSVSGTWTQKNSKTTSLADIDHWLEQGEWLSERILDADNHQDFLKMLDEGKCDVDIDGNQLNLTFSGHNYVEWYLTIQCPEKSNDKTVIVSTGYYFN